MTIHDLARLAGLNPSTVSRALRNDPRVRSATRERIAALAAEHGYVPNLNARNLADGKTRIIALLMGSLEFQVEREAAVCLNEIFSEHGYTLMILSYAPKAEELYPARLKILTQKICDGAILFTPGDAFLTPETRSILDSIRCPRVYLDRWFREYPLPTVTTDNTVAMRGLCDLAESAGMDGAVLFFHEHNTVSRDRKKRLLRELKRRRIPHLELHRSQRRPSASSASSPGISHGDLRPDTSRGPLLLRSDLSLHPELPEDCGTCRRSSSPAAQRRSSCSADSDGTPGGVPDLLIQQKIKTKKDGRPENQRPSFSLSVRDAFMRSAASESSCKFSEPPRGPPCPEPARAGTRATAW